MDCVRITDELVMEKYLLGNLSDSEREAFEQHFFECDECFARLEALQAAQQALAARPVSRAFQIEHPQRIRTWGWPVAAAALVVIGLVAVLWWVMRPPFPRTAALSPALLQLTQIEPPSYEPVRLRGAQDEAQQRFRTAMEFYSAGDYASAIPGLDEAAGLDPNAPNISFYLGACYLLEGRTSEGIESLQHTVDLGDTPYLEEALLLLAKARIRQRDLDAARAALERVVSLEGDFASEANDMLERLRGAAPAR
jgi:tetratricopeptide (TPR) repeat protein